MSKFIDLTGQRFGRWTVIEIGSDYVSPRGSVIHRWSCKCDCGNNGLVDGSSLINGKSKSCGCIKKEKRAHNFINLAGQRFGRLVAIETNGKNKNGGTFWKCKCDCGNEVIVASGHLRSKHTQSCGCLQKDTMLDKIIDLTGFSFGRWTVIERVENDEYGKRLWLCRCDCGVEKIIHGTSLKNGDTKSCGCWNKELLRIKYGEASFNQLYRRYESGAKRRWFSFELTKNYFEKITKQNCFYCGAEPNQTIKNKFDNGDYVYNGIDRIDSLKGYTVDNVVPCCGRCNEAKMSESQLDFLSWVGRVYNHSVKGKNMSEKFDPEKYLNKMIETLLKDNDFKEVWESYNDVQKNDFRENLYQEMIVPLLKFGNFLEDLNKELQ